MQSNLISEFGPFMGVLVALGAGTAGIIGLAALAEWFVRSAFWRRTAWRVCTLAIVLLVLAELTGVGAGLVWVAGVNRASSAGHFDKGAHKDATHHASGLGGARAVLDSGRGLGTPDESVVDTRIGVDRVRHGLLVGRVSSGLEGLTACEQAVPHGYKISSRVSTDHSGKDELSCGILAESEIALSASYADDFDGELDVSHASPPISDSDFENAPPTATGHHVEPAPASPMPVAREAGFDVALRFGLLWLLGAVVLAVCVVCSRLLLLVFVARRAQPLCDEAIAGRVIALARRMGIRRSIRLAEVPGLSAPVAFGILRPTIALPISFSSDFDYRQQQVMLAHELAHLAARDPVWLWVADLLTAGLWWHPLVWWSRRRLRATSETAADEASLLVPQGPDALASCLVELGKRLTKAPSHRLGWLSVGGSDFRSGLGRRVQRLLDLPQRSWRIPARTPSLLIMGTLPAALVLLTVFCTAWGRPQATLPQGETTMKVIQSSWHRSLAASAMVPLLSLFSGDALSDDATVDQPESVVASDDSLDTVQLALLDDDEREEAEERERREERERHERREIREREEREERERRERAEHGERLERELHELREKAEHIERELREHPDGEEARELRTHLREIHERMEDIHREFGGRDRERAEHERRERAEHAERERDERARHMEELKHEYRELREKAEHIKRELKGLRDDQDGEARELQDTLREIQERMEQIARHARGGERERHHEMERREAEERKRHAAHEREMMQHRRELEKRAHRIRRELEGLRDNQDEEARELHAALREIEEEMHRLEHQHRDHERGREREDVHRRLEEMERAYHHAREVGREEEAERIRREMEEIAEHLEGRRPVPQSPAVPEQVRRELEEMKGAVRHLHGQMEEMRHQMEEMHRLLRALAEHDDEREHDEDEDDEEDDD